jgi:hypothetical protein
MTKDEAMKLALEALKGCYKVFHEDEDIADAIKALEKALKQESRNVTKNEHDILMKAVMRSGKVVSDGFLTPKVNMLNTVAKPIQQDQDEHYKGVIEGVQKLFDDKRKAKQEQGEPVAWMDKTGITHKHKHFEDMQPLYTHPQPKREPLTDEQIDEIHQSTWMQSTATLNDFARAIEAAHGIKE